MHEPTRRQTLHWMSAAALAGCATAPGQPLPQGDSVADVAALGTRWPTPDPFLFCVHHDDRYPEGNERMGPVAPLQGRDIGRDFSGKDGWSMYHGRDVPGFPRHPHRGFETVTVTRRGLIDHSDSLGATARYGEGDVQWLTAGGGINHAEMFPLRSLDRPNPVELFQIWLNLPAADKHAPAHFKMFWSDTVPRLALPGGGELVAVAGPIQGLTPPAPPPRSWAARPDSEVAIWTVRLARGTRFTLPPASPGLNRWLYFFRGTELTVGGHPVPPAHRVVLRPELPALLEAGATEEAEVLVLQGRPIGEPIARHGPFVMNTREEIEQAYRDYRATGFGGWPWERPDPVHDRGTGRFAIHADGKTESPA